MEKTAATATLGLLEFKLMLLRHSRCTLVASREATFVHVYIDGLLTDLKYVDELTQHLSLPLQPVSSSSWKVWARQSGPDLPRPQDHSRDVRPGEDKVRCILEYAVPSSNKKYKALLGLVCFYRCFIFEATIRLLPLTDLRHGNPHRPAPTNAAIVKFSEVKSSKHSAAKAPGPAFYA